VLARCAFDLIDAQIQSAHACANFRFLLIIRNCMDISTKPLRDRGMRVTPQRAHVWRLLAESEAHLSAEEIWERARDVLPGMELSTVYRSLEALREADLVVENRLPEGPALFEARASSHPHLVCERCGKVSHPEASPEVTSGLLAALAAGSEGFEVRELHVVARGMCVECAGRAPETRD
jgi:Fe2+ or Zn2+ uptake regulation protein